MRSAIAPGARRALAPARRSAAKDGGFTVTRSGGRRS